MAHPPKFTFTQHCCQRMKTAVKKIPILGSVIHSAVLAWKRPFKQSRFILMFKHAERLMQKKRQFLCGEYRLVIAQKFTAYQGATYFGRHYYDCGDTFVKKYLLKKGSDNVNQILHEICHYQSLPENNFFPRLLAQHRTEKFIEVMFSKLPGNNLHDLLLNGHSIQPLQIFQDVVQALAFLLQQGLYHNDVRLWNMMFDGHKTYLFDLGLARMAEHESTNLALLWLIKQLHDFSAQIFPYPIVNAPDFQAVKLSAPFVEIVARLQKSHSFADFLGQYKISD